MSKVKMDLASSLIREKKYNEARKILRTVNHPTAREWLEKLDRIDPKARSPRPQSQLRKVLQTVVIFTIALIAISAAVLLDPRAGGYNPFQIVPTSDVAATALAIEPLDINIVDTDQSGVPERFLDKARHAIAPFGYVETYAAEINSTKRFTVDLDARLIVAQGRGSAALELAEQMLRLYATEIDANVAGEIVVRVFWKSQIECAASVGMGYKVMQSIDWQRVDQSALFRILNKELQHDNAPTYGDIAWIHKPIQERCRN